MKKHPIRLFDTHAHPQFPQYDHDRDAVITAALDAGVGMLCVGTDIATSRSAINLSERYEGIFASVGVHPNDALDAPVDFDELKQLAMHKKVVAIGETGLDFYRTKDDHARSAQRQRFVEHIRMAGELHLPLIIHCRDGADASAHSALLSLLRPTSYSPHPSLQPTPHSLYPSPQPTPYKLPPSGAGVIHSFTGTAEQAKQYIELGFAIGLNGIVTFSTEYEEMVRSLPEKAILLETDAPYLAPVPHRGRRNEPFYILEVAKKVAIIKGVPTETLIEASLINTLRTFSNVYI